MADWFNWVTWATLAVLAFASLVVLLYPTGGAVGARLRPWVDRCLARVSGPGDLEWLDWKPVMLVGLLVFAAVSTYGVVSGQYGCRPPGLSDPVGLLNSGRAFWAGQNPFSVPDCGGQIDVPYGLAAVLLDALGSLGGVPGIYVVWGAIAFTIVPLVGHLATTDRRQVLLYVGTSVLLVPVVTSQIDGATNAIVPVVVLLSLYLAERHEIAAAALGGFLSSARFPNLFPVLAGTGGRRSRYLAFATAAASFGAATALAYALWGSNFLDPVFFQQLGRRSFSLNLYGVLLLSNALPSSLAIEVGQATLTLALVLAAFFFVRSPIRSVAIVLTGLALLTPFLSFTILVWLLPVALAGTRARWWLWGVALVGSLNYDLALNVWAWEDGVSWPSAALDVVLTVLLIALFVELWRTELAARRPLAAASGVR